MSTYIVVPLFLLFLLLLLSFFFGILLTLVAERSTYRNRNEQSLTLNKTNEPTYHTKNCINRVEDKEKNKTDHFGKKLRVRRKKIHCDIMGRLDLLDPLEKQTESQ